MEKNHEFQISEFNMYGIETVIIKNKMLSVRILPGKGGDISQITYLPQGIKLLLEHPEVFSQYEGRNLHKEVLSYYSELATGGWQDVVPGFGSYGDMKLDQRPIGLAAVVPWSYRILQREEEISVCMEVHLPQFPLCISKKITLKKAEAAVYLEETIYNKGKMEATMTWTQHSAFGGNFLDESVRITYPSEQIFFPSAYVGNSRLRGEFQSSLASVRMPDGTIHDLHRMRKKAEDGMMIFTQKADVASFEMVNENKQVAVRMEWDHEVFPYLRCWYQNDHKDYGLALEPSNYGCSTYEECVSNATLLHINPKESIRTELVLKIHKKISQPLVEERELV